MQESYIDKEVPVEVPPAGIGLELDFGQDEKGVMPVAALADSIVPDGQQYAALRAMKEWYGAYRKGERIKPYFLCLGYAGTGKTTLVKFLLNELGLETGRVAFGTYTGKASVVLSRKSGSTACTLHSLIYTLYIDPLTRKKRWMINQNSSLYDVDLVVLDECSMIGKEMWQDLLYFGAPILLLGDKGQLPPIKDIDFISTLTPDVVLTQVHRQALDNPIIRLSMMARRGEYIPYGVYENKVFCLRRSDIDAETWLQADIVLCGFNSTRRELNSFFRDRLGYNDAYPQVGSKLICLKNQWDLGLVNGMVGYSTSESYVDREDQSVSFTFLEEDRDPQTAKAVTASKSVFDGNFSKKEERNAGFGSYGVLTNQPLSEFDYGYAITVHKSQGSEWRDVMLVDEWRGEISRRWLYTGITRASERLIIVR